MKKLYFLLFILFSIATNAQVFEVDTLQYSGTSDKFINIVIMGDGYTESQQDDFIATATTLSNSLMNQSPWMQYQNYFNVFAIKVISLESGARHANTASDCNTAFPLVPVSTPNTYFRSRFDYLGIHRLIVPQLSGAIASVLAANLPDYDQAIIVANTPYYGGSGGTWATSTADSDAYEVVAHEVGHSFANLADEYYAGEIYFTEKPNMTQESNPNLIKWKNWITDDTTIDMYNYCCGGTTGLWYKPSDHSCKMEVLGASYCAVCQQTIVEKIHAIVNPVVAFVPTELNIATEQQFIDFNLSQLMKPVPNTLHIKWQLDETVYDTNTESFQLNQNVLSFGNHTLTAIVSDDTELIRVDNHSDVHFSTVSWTINHSELGTQLFASDNKFGYAIVPNPASQFVNVELELTKSSNIAIDLIATDGKIVQQIPVIMASEGKFSQQINIENLANGSFIIAVKIDGATFTKTMVKE